MTSELPIVLLEVRMKTMVCQNDRCLWCGAQCEVLEVCFSKELKHEYAVLFCSACLLGFTQADCTDEELSALYKQDYASYQERSSALSYLRSFRHWIVFRNIRSFFGVAPSSLLDYGCGSGRLLLQARKRYATVTGVEFSRYARDMLAEKHGLHILTPNDMQSIASGSVQVVTLLHVLEHVRSPDAVLRELRRILAPDGLLVVRVPNIRAFSRKIYGKHWFAYDVPRHLWHFTDASMNKVLKENGFKIRKQTATPLDTLNIVLESEKSGGGSFVRGFFIACICMIIEMFAPHLSGSRTYYANVA